MSAFNWPRSYLLEIYNKAIASGHLVIHPISEAQAESLKMSLYRLRRRSDSSNRSFITPQMHLVTVGKWSNNQLPILFTSTPDGELPSITPVGDAPDAGYQQLIPEPVDDVVITEKKVFDIAKTELEMKPADISDYVANMLAKVKKGEEE